MEGFVAELTVLLVMSADRVSYAFPLREDVLQACLAREERVAAACAAPPVGDVAIRTPLSLPVVIDQVRAMAEKD